MKINKQKNQGFTLIELLIATTLTVLLMLTISSLFMTFLIGGSRTNVRKTLKDEGNYAISQIEFLLKNARYIDESVAICNNGMSQIGLISIDNGQTVLSRQGSKIASNSAFLTSDAVTVAVGPVFNCTGEAGNRQVEVLFTLEKNSPDGAQNEYFTTIVNVRN